MESHARPDRHDPVYGLSQDNSSEQCFGWLAEKIGRLKVLLFTILLFVSMDIALPLRSRRWNEWLFIVQGGTGGEGGSSCGQRLHQ